ncbi:MAG TPA: hypothetical protein P5280_13290 [Cyclobacteriaceae bacterium]|nr:hypothetical protein [Cyclobacteriaceae bacterium]
MTNPIVWYVDEDETQSKTYVNELRMLLQSSLDVQAIYPPFRTKEEYLPILKNPKTACLVFDQRLKDTGMATYSGIELATYIRSVNSKIPIYILTNYARDDEEKEEFSDKSWSVEQIIDKGSLNRDEYAQEISSRILRHINVYEDILGEREAKFRSLLQKSVVSGLTENEQAEFDKLQFERSQVTLASELPEKQELDELVKINSQLLDLLQQKKDE